MSDCPYIETTDEGTSYCKLAEKQGRNAKIMDEMAEALRWVREYVSGYCVIIHPEKNTKGLSPEEAIKAKIDEALTAYNKERGE